MMLLAFLAAGMAAPLVSAQEPQSPASAAAAAGAVGGDKSTQDGVYTEAQSERGAATAKTTCAACHGRTMKGGMLGPSVVGDTFKGNYSGRPLGELFEKIQVTMPQNNPGTLTPETTADLVAFILKLNEFPAGEAEIPADLEAVNKITFKQ
jgi:S-disulfanyl-L-cysteine oxidoreductase SoxD